MHSDPTDRPGPTPAEPARPTEPAVPAPEDSAPAGSGPEEAESPTADPPAPPENPRRRRILIGSQRNPDAYRPKPKRDWTPVTGEPPAAGKKKAEEAGEQQTSAAQPEDQPPATIEGPAAVSEDRAESATADPSDEPAVGIDEDLGEDLAEAQQWIEQLGPLPAAGKRFPPPSKRGELPADLEDEFQEAVAGAALDELMTEDDRLTRQSLLDAESKQAGRVVAVGREDVFVELGSREQGIVPRKQFEEPPAVDSPIDVRVVRFNAEEGLYELSLPGAAAEVGDWSDLEEGMLVEARVTGHNTGGLECDVNHIRGFIPVSQIALYHVENLAEFVDEKFTCLVTEANPRRRNLVLSRRAVLEREKEETRAQLLESLEPGQLRDGVVRKLTDFGAFVDLGGIDGLLHVSQLSWARVKHPSDVLQVGQTIQVKVDKVDKAAGRISLGYREMLENPWTDVEKKYPPTATLRGQVTKLMEFGAFVELEPGVEGLVHISQLAHRRVWRVSDVVKEGDEVEVVVLSVDAEAQRIGLSMKDALPEPEPAKALDAAEPSQPPPKKKLPPKPSKPLKGGLGRSPMGEQFGLKW